VSESDPPQVRCTPTDPSIEFDVFELVRLRLVEALVEGGYEALEAERIALYAVGGARPVSRLLKLATGARPSSHAEVIEALTLFLDEAHELEKARRILLRLEDAV